ncbi:MAG: hypothetical protein EAZ15_01980 [Sphingobacteriales bacterium]|nr:MAG: hypothetical protein EAZ15_01980 [Sphingobacteriales bacterium]
MNNDSKTISYLPGFIIWIIAEVLITDPIFSYFVAWAGSFFIFYWTIYSNFRYINDDLPLKDQVLRPIIIVQLIFAGFMCSSSIFYFLNHLGYRYLEKVDFSANVPNSQTYLIAQCQRLSLLAHAALVAGIILLTPQKYKNQRKNIIAPDVDINIFLGKFSIITFLGAIAIRFVPGFSQFSEGLTSVSVFSGTFLLVKGLANKNKKLLYLGAGLFLSNLVKATLSGFKEPILMSLIILGCLLFPVYKKLTLYLGIPLLYGLLYALPTYVNVIRTNSWSGDTSAEASRTIAIDTLLDADNAELIDDTNWAFLTERISEINMFTQFVANTPEEIDYYGFEIVTESLYALIPRILWEEKPITEEISMKRVYAAGVISENSIVSAKTRPVVDAYLSFGTFGVFIFFILIGLIAQGLCNTSENLYGGYQFGSVIIMGTFSNTLWRGNNFEFMFNSLFYGYVLILIICEILKLYKILKPLEYPICDNQDMFLGTSKTDN